MRVLIDSNVLFSAVLFPNSAPAKAYFKAVSYPNTGLVCEQNIIELRRNFNRKFPDKMSSLEKFLALAMLSLEIIPTPVDENESEDKIRDKDDRPILRAAIAANADIIITGDKDFLESGITDPKIMTVREFLDM